MLRQREKTGRLRWIVLTRFWRARVQAGGDERRCCSGRACRAALIALRSAATAQGSRQAEQILQLIVVSAVVGPGMAGALEPRLA